MTEFIKSFISDENGASAAEYALILAIIGTGIAAAALTLGSSISTAMTKSASCISAPATASNCS